MTATTSIHSSVTGWPDCSNTSYNGDKALFTFSTGIGVGARVTLEAITGGTNNYDLFAVSSTACDGTGMCAGKSTGATDEERVVFTATAADTFLVGYDRLSSGTGSTQVVLNVTCEPLCGNRLLDGGEDCDDGNRNDGDGCSSTCHIEPGFGCTGPGLSVCTHIMCGNGMLEAGETCDDGGTSPGDGCDAHCRAEMFTATPASGKSTTIHGTLGSSTPTFSRPNPCGSEFSNSFFHYQTFVIENMTAAAQTLKITAAWMDDGYLVVYSPPFRPKMPLAECLNSDDDDGPGPQSSQLTDVHIQAGQQLIVVATTYNPDATIGDFTLTIDAN